jgi:hypothetical protein
MKLQIKATDILIVFLAVGLTFSSVYFAYLKPQNSMHVLIRGQGSEWIFPMSVDETVVVKGPLGNTVVRIKDDSVRVESSPCKNQICVAAGTLRRHGTWAVCLPNNVLVMIEGTDEKSDVDAIVR